jgi:hypothetical protein
MDSDEYLMTVEILVGGEGKIQRICLPWRKILYASGGLGGVRGREAEMSQNDSHMVCCNYSYKIQIQS